MRLILWTAGVTNYDCLGKAIKTYINNYRRERQIEDALWYSEMLLDGFRQCHVAISSIELNLNPKDWDLQKDMFTYTTWHVSVKFGSHLPLRPFEVMNIHDLVFFLSIDITSIKKYLSTLEPDLWALYLWYITSMSYFKLN